MVADALSRKSVSALSLNRGIWKFSSDGALIAYKKAESELRQCIVKAQQEDPKLLQTIQKVKESKQADFVIKEDGTLYFKDRLCVPANDELKKKLLHEAFPAVPLVKVIMEMI